MISTTGRGLVALAVGFAGGALFHAIQAPLPWTLGSLLAAAALAVGLGEAWALPSMVRNLARPAVGVLAGGTFTLAILQSAVSWWPAILMVMGFTALIGCLGYLWFRYVAGFDHTTAYFAAMPAGLGELTLVGGSLGGDMRKLVIVHFVRVITIVITIPFALQILLDMPIGRGLAPDHARDVITAFDAAVLGACGVAGYLMNRLLPIPAGPMLYPMLLSGAVHVLSVTTAVPPGWMIVGVQVTIGCVIGGRFVGIRRAEARTILLVSVGWAVALLGIVACAGTLFSHLLGRDLGSTLLSIAPAGMVEMTVMSLALPGDTAFVVTLQTLRILAVVITAPLLFGLVTRGWRDRAQ